MEQRLSLVTLGVADLARSRRFYEEGLGWRPAFASGEVAFFQLGGMGLALFGRRDLAEDARMADEPTGFSAVALAYNTRTREQVAAVLAEAVAAGARLLKPAQDLSWGGHGGYFADPDGHLWEVAFNPFWPMGEDGSVRIAG